MTDITEDDYAFLDLLEMSPPPPPPPSPTVPRKRTNHQLDFAFLDLLQEPSNGQPKRQRRETEEDTYQRVTRDNFDHRCIMAPRVAEEAEAPISERELAAMREHTHDINTSSLIKKITPDKQWKKPPRRCEHLSVADSIETTLGPDGTKYLEVLPHATLTAEDYRRQGGFEGAVAADTDAAVSVSDPRKTYLENDILLDHTVMSTITDATEDDAEMMEAVAQVPKRAEQILPIAERATLQRAYCKNIIVRSQDEPDRRVAAAIEWIRRDSADTRHISQLMRAALHTHARSNGIRMHRVRYEATSGRQGEEVRPLPFHISAFTPADQQELSRKVMLPRKFEENILLRAPIYQLNERPCANGIICQGNVIFMDAHFQLREFVTPDEYHTFTATGKWPHLSQDARPCLLCMRSIINTAYYAALGAGEYMDNASYPLGNICNYVDRPGEYAATDCISNNLTHAGLVGPLVRHTLTKYSTVVQRVPLPDRSMADVTFVVQHGMETLRTEAGRELHFRQGPL